MKLLLITPYYPPSVRGNAVTTHRLVCGLRERGIHVEVVSLENCALEDAVEVALRLRPDLIHAFHAFASAKFVRAIQKIQPVPFVLTVTGTDINHDLDDPDKRGAVLGMLRDALVIVAFHHSMSDRMNGADASLANKTKIIKQAVRLQSSNRDFRTELGIADDEVVFTLPAGIRRVKDILASYQPLMRLKKEGLHVRLLFAGPVIERDYADEVMTRIRSADWAAYLGAVPHSDMQALYRASDVIMNTSISEGGMCNAVLEGLAAGKPVLASDIPGNRSVVKEGETGFIFANEEEFEHKARTLITNEPLRNQFGQAAHRYMEHEFSFEREIEEHLQVYRTVTNHPV